MLSRIRRCIYCKRRSTCVWPLVIVPLLAIMLTVFICRDIPLSPVFRLFHRDKQELLKQALASNNLRLNEATRYFESTKPADSIKFYNREFDSQVDLVITIVTVKRTTGRHKFTIGYLTQTAAALDRIVKSSTKFSIKLFLCNTDSNGPNHTEAGFVSLYIPMVTKNIDQSINSNKIKNSKRQKETMDYLYCLEQAKAITPRYILMVEDDSVPNENFLEVIKHSLKQIGDRNFAYLKLFYPLKWQGFALETSRLLELVCFGTIGGSLSMVLHHFCLSRNTHWKYLQNAQFTVGMLCTMVVIYLIGRQNVMTFRTLSHHLHSLRPSSACCTPAMLYPMETVPPLIHFINSSQQLVKQLHIDLQIYKFTQTHHVPGYQIEPNLFRHIGMVSSLSSVVKKPEEFL